MKKWIFAAATTFVLASTPVHAAEKKFHDVTMYEAEVDYLVNTQLIAGFADGTFKPHEPLTRLQAVTILLRDLKPQLDLVPMAYTDVLLGDYGYEQVMQATALQIMGGKLDGTFDRFGYLTRAQMAKILVEAYNLQPNDTNKKRFQDVKLSAWYADYVQTLASNNIVSGYADGTFRPNEPISRIHFAVMFSRFLQQREQLIHNPDIDQPDGLSPIIPKPTDPTPTLPR